MSGMVENPEDLFSHDVAQIMVTLFINSALKGTILFKDMYV